MEARHTIPRNSQKVVHIKPDPYDSYIGRGSIWGNPFKIGPDGDRRQVLAKYKEYLLRGEGRHLLQRIGELEGKTLGCSCAGYGGLTAQVRLSVTGSYSLGSCNSRRGGRQKHDRNQRRSLEALTAAEARKPPVLAERMNRIRGDVRAASRGPQALSRRLTERMVHRLIHRMFR